MEFQKQKIKQLSKPDKSNIGLWDLRIKDLCDKINQDKDYYTTSSCSGRIVLIKSLDKKAENVFLFRTHKKITLKELNKVLEKIKYNQLIEFKQTPCILHVACFSLEKAQELIDKAKFAGWKNSGIMSIKKRIIVELNSTENLSFPIMNCKKKLVDNEFLKLSIGLANKKLEKSWEKINKLHKSI